MSSKNYLIKFLAVLSMLVFSYAAFAQTITVKGTVLETDGKTPVLGCGV